MSENFCELFLMVLKYSAIQFVFNVLHSPETVRTLTVKLPNGKLINIDLHPVTVQQPSATTTTTTHNTDKIQAYSQLVLELGMLFKNFTEAIKVPNRQRMLRTLKLMLVVLKADNNKSKYADEILRFLVQQISTLSEHDANKQFYSMFVNTQGHIDSHIPADIQMEFIVRTYKKYIRHMVSNKTESNITRKTGALGGIYNIAAHYDNITPVVNRTKKHSQPSDTTDEVTMINDLREIKPFTVKNDRCHSTFPRVEKSLLTGLNYDHFHKWLLHRVAVHGSSLGN